MAIEPLEDRLLLSVVPGVTTNPNPMDYGFINFEEGTEGSQIISQIPGVQFTTTLGFNWLYGDAQYYNTHSLTDPGYGSGRYVVNGHFFAWLGESADQGRINFTEGPARYFSGLVSTYSGVTLDAYDANGNFLESSGWASGNLDSDTFTRLTIDRPQQDIAYVMVHDTGNYWLIDDILTDAPGLPKLELESLKAYDDFFIGTDTDPTIWTDTDPTPDAIADGIRNTYSSTGPGSFKIEAKIKEPSAMPAWDPTVKYSWAIAGTGMSGNSQFTGWEGDFSVKMPQAVGQYDLSLSFEIYDNNGNKLNTQSMTHTLYSTYKTSLFAQPEETVLGKAVTWASGAKNEADVASKINNAIHNTGWLYGYPGFGSPSGNVLDASEYYDGYGSPEEWTRMVKGAARGTDCVGFSNTWEGLARTLGVDVSTVQVSGSEDLGFVTKLNSVSPDGKPGNAHPAGVQVDRWFFPMHQIGQLGAWFWSDFYDPTFGAKYDTRNEFIQWDRLTSFDSSTGWADLTGGHRLAQMNYSGNYGWGDYVYHSPFDESNIDPDDGAAFTGDYLVYGVDPDADGVYDNLVIEVGVQVTGGGQYVAAGSVLQNGVELTSRSNMGATIHSYAEFSGSEPGLQTLTLLFSGEDIYQSGLDGIYTADLVILDENGFIIDNRQFTGPAYEHSQFGELPVRIEALADWAEDSDADGLFDYLTAGVTMSVATPGDYSLTGTLYSGLGDVLTVVTADAATDSPGVSTVQLELDGAKINGAQTNGPYLLAIDLRDDKGTQFGYQEYQTAAYGYADFEGPSERFAGTYSDQGVDIDADGLFDYLAIDVGLEISTPGEYTVEGWLYDSAGTAVEVATTSVNLATGAQSVTLDFNGTSINKNQVDGPYELKHLVLSGSGWIDYVEDAATTSAYSYAAFESLPTILLTGEYNDYLQDVDADGIPDYLTVDVGVMVDTDGFSVLQARLMDGNGQEIVTAETVAYLTAGAPHVMELDFDGQALYDHGVDGPFYVKDVYVYHTGHPSQPDYVHDAHVTAPYDIGEFSENTAPTVDAGDDVIVNEGAIFTASGFFIDPEADTWTATVDYGDDSGVLGLALNPDKSFALNHVYGDDGVYTVRVTVSDDNGGVGEDTLTATVNNVAPTLTLDTAAALTFGDGEAFLGRVGVEQSHDTSATDPGSDALTFEWDFEVVTISNSYFVDPILDPDGLDPVGSQNVAPRDVSDTAGVTFTEPGVYTITVTVRDADGGSDSVEFTKLVTNDMQEARSQGFWRHQFAGGKQQHIQDAALLAYLDIVDFASHVFGEEVPLGSLAEASDVFQPGGLDVGDPHLSNMKGKATQQALAAWLNFASGEILWDQLVPTGQASDPEDPFSLAIMGIEDLLLDLDGDDDHEDYVLANDIATAINEMDE